MKVTLKNDLLTVDIDTHGAELQSIRNTRTSEEFLWQGDPTFWGRRSPVLFPIVGSVWNNKFRVDGVEYDMSQHGFARDSEFRVVETDNEGEAWFVLESDEKTLQRFPFRFRLFVGYALDGERLRVMWRVENIDSRDIVFQIGAHPAFNYPQFNAADDVHGYFNIDGTNLHSQVISERGCIGPDEKHIELDGDQMLELSTTTFAGDALVFADRQVRRVSMLDREKKPYLTLLFDAPVVGLWSPPAGNAPFVCIEPWWGRADRVGFDGEFSEREYVNRLAPAHNFTAGYMIIIERV